MVYLTGKQKASVLLHILGADVSSAILQQLPENMAAYITAGFSGPPTPDQIAQVLYELRSLPPGQDDEGSTIDESTLKKVPSSDELDKLSGLAKYCPDLFIEVLSKERKELQMFFISKLPEELKLDFSVRMFGKSNCKTSEALPVLASIVPNLEKKFIDIVKSKIATANI